MAPENPPPTKRRRLPFEPPRPRASPSAGPSSIPNDANKKATKKRSSANARTSSAASEPRTSTSSTQRNPSRTPSSSRPSESSPRNRDRNPNGTPEDDEPDYILAEITTHEKDTTDILSSAPTIPPKLLTRLLAHHFQDPKTKLAKDANGVVAKYVDVFVREALARAAYESSGGGGGDARGEETGRARGIGDGFLEVEDLEKMAPQLILDF